MPCDVAFADLRRDADVQKLRKSRPGRSCYFSPRAISFPAGAGYNHVHAVRIDPSARAGDRTAATQKRKWHVGEYSPAGDAVAVRQGRVLHFADDLRNSCAFCKRPLAESYYTANAKVICEPCHGQLTAFLAGGSPLKRALAAAALGLLAALAGAAIWYAVRKMTESEFGIVAIAVGLMVGFAVRKGSAGRGGWFYQVLAIALTYSCVCAQYIPDLVEAALKGVHERHAALARPANPAAGHGDDKAAAKNEPAKNQPAKNEPRKMPKHKSRRPPIPHPSPEPV